MLYHRLKFRADSLLDLLLPGKRKVRMVRVERGDVIEASVHPYIQESAEGPVEVADLVWDEEGILLGVRMACFRFWEEEGPKG